MILLTDLEKQGIVCKVIGLNLFKKSPFSQIIINIDKYLLTENSIGIGNKKISTQDIYL